MSGEKRRSVLNLGSESKKVAERDSSIILMTDFIETNDCCQIENIIENDSIQIVVGTNKYDPDDQAKTRINPVLSAAGILINESISPSFVFNPDKKEEPGTDYFNLNQAAPQGVDVNLINQHEKGISTVTVFGDHIQLISNLNGVNIYTSPKILSKLRGLPEINVGAGVSLIHGNVTDNLEKMVLGKKLIDHLNKLDKVILDVNNQVFTLGTVFTAFLGIYSAHFHLAPQAPVGVVPTLPDIAGIVYSIGAIPLQVKSRIDEIIGTINQTIVKVNSTEAFESSFLSAYHKLN